MTPEIQGLVLTAVGVQFSVLANSAIKTVEANVSLVQAMQLRSGMQFIFSLIAALVLRRRGHTVCLLGQPAHRPLLLARAVTCASALLSLWTALRLMPVGVATTILYLYPVFCGLLACGFLGEPLDWRFWAQVVVSCAGVLMVASIGPTSVSGDSGLSGRGVALTLLSALGFASTNCLVRALRTAQTIEVQLFTDTVMAFVAMPAALVFTGDLSNWGAWQAPQFAHLLAATAAGLTALLMVIKGHQLASASQATLFSYLEVPGAFVAQVFLFQELPTPRQLLGAAMIVSAALLRLWHETSSALKVDPAPLLSKAEATENEQAPDVAAKC